MSDAMETCISRAKEQKLISKNYTQATLVMDLDSCVATKTLDLAKLAQAPDADFVHDICGIARHLDRSAYPGKLLSFFLPRRSPRKKQVPR